MTWSAPGIAGVPHQRGRAGVAEEEADRVALDLPRDIEHIARVEADIEGLGAILGIELLGRGPRIGAVRRERHRAGADGELDRVRAVGGDRGDPIHRFGEAAVRHRHHVLVAARNHPLVVRERAVDQLGGELGGADLEADSGFGQRDGDRLVAIVDQLAHLGHGLARDDHGRHVRRSLRQRHIGAGRAGGRRWRRRAAARYPPGPPPCAGVCR